MVVKTGSSNSMSVSTHLTQTQIGPQGLKNRVSACWGALTYPQILLRRHKKAEPIRNCPGNLVYTVIESEERWVSARGA